MSRTVVDHLNTDLATAFVLSFNAKRYHRTVTGPHFRDYHFRFEDPYRAADGTADLLTRFVQVHQKEARFLRKMLA
jgi:DNA-binding ferritin-like protein